MITIEEFKKKQLNTSRLIGLDLGSKRIGVAICDENQKIATPLKTINKSKFEDLINELEDIIKENNIKGIIIGNPINMDGTFGKSSQSVNDVSKAISKEIDLLHRPNQPTRSSGPSKPTISIRSTRPA